VIRIESPDGTVQFPEGVSLYDATCIYRVDRHVAAAAWEADRWIECGGGIHFYLTREEALAHC